MLRLRFLCFDSRVTGCAIPIYAWSSPSPSLSFRSIRDTLKDGQIFPFPSLYCGRIHVLLGLLIDH